MYKYMCKVYHEVLMNGFYLFLIILTITEKVNSEVFPRGSIEKNSYVGNLTSQSLFWWTKKLKCGNYCSC